MGPNGTASSVIEVRPDPPYAAGRAVTSPRSSRRPADEAAGTADVVGLRLRVEPTKNKQAKGMRWAKDYVLGGKVEVAAAAG
jgi:hypothetical protein